MTKGYHIQQLLFQTGKTAFYIAVDENNNTVFLQEPNGEFPSLDELVGLKNDFEITHTLHAEGVLKSLALEKSQSGVALVKEYFDGIPLSRFIQTKNITVEDFLKIAISLAEILHQVHSNSIIHKDINPDNFLINSNTFQIKLWNFHSASSLTKEQPELNNSGTLQGSLLYISPEQTGRMNRSVDHRSDLYSLGITLYRLLCARLPFNYKNVMELVHAHLAKHPDEPCTIDKNIPKILSDIVMKLIEKNAEDRYQSAKGLKHDLEKCLQEYLLNGSIKSFILAVNDFSPIFRISEKLYGRDKEVAQLIDTFEATRKGIIDLVLVAGYSGIGKTRLINEIHKPIAKQNGYFISGKFDQYNRNNPYSAITGAFSSLIKQFLSESVENFNYRKQKIFAALGENAQVLIDVIPELELLIGKQPSVLKLGLNETQNRFFDLFEKFLKSFVSEEHPLVIFIDDLQWADSGSLELLYVLLKSKEINHVLIIGAYRNNEVSISHPLMLMLNRLTSEDKKIKTLTLAELEKDDVNQLIADSFHQYQKDTTELTELVMNKTRGNPFFINRFIQKLVQERLICFETAQGKWKWDADKINTMNITDNVVDLLISKIQTLQPATQHVLRLASCIGNRFDLEILSIISEREKSDVAKSIWEAIKEDLIHPLGQWSLHSDDRLWEELDIKLNNNQTKIFQFQHDRIQQASYSLIPDEEKKKTHLQIGRLLLKKLSSSETHDDVFNIVVHFNLAADLIEEKEERIKIAELNLEAGQRAKNSNAYQPAANYLEAGMHLIENTGNTILLNEFLVERSESEYLCGHYDASEKLFDAAVEHAKTNLEKAEVLAKKMQLYENTARQPEAIKIALEGLKLLGIRLPEKPGPVRIFRELLKAKFYLRRKSIDDLKNNNDLKSHELILAMKILTNLWGPAYLNNQNLLALGILKMVTISVRYGNCPESALAYAFYGFVLSAQLKDYSNGFEFGKLGMWLNEKFEDKMLRAKVYVIFAGCIAHWKLDFAALAEPLRKAHEVGIETNDLIYAGYAVNFLSKIHYMEGDALDSVYEKCKSYVHFGRQTHHITTMHHLLTQTRIVCKLMNKEIEEEVFMNSADEEMHKQQTTEYGEKEGVLLPITFHNYFQTEWYFRMEDYERALQYYHETKKTISVLLGFPENVVLEFFHSLTLLSLAKSNRTYTGKKILHIIRSNQKRLRKASKTSPKNFLAKYILVEAEIEAFNNKFESAAISFRRAKEAAIMSNIIQDVALINECAAKFYKSHGFTEVSNSLLREAIRNYQEWGAIAKVNRLQQKLRQEGITSNNQAVSQNTNTDAFSLTATSTTLDLQSIFEASTAISGEVVFDKLLKKLMKIVLENAGAQTGYLVLVKNGNLVVAAEGNMENETVNVLNEIAFESFSNIPQSIIRFVFHTSDTLIINDPSNDLRFSKDNYLIQQKPKSILCLPIIQSGNCIAIIYLENNLAANAFTPARCEVLKLLSGQIAVSMENAVLYNKQTELSNAYQRFVPHDFISALGHQNILQVKLGDSIDQQMTAMFCDIRSYTSLAEGLSAQENFDLINSYLTLIGPVIKRNHGFINHYLGDGFIALFKNNPEDSLHAAIEMISELKKLNAQREQVGQKLINIGIGLHTGKVMMGIIGDLERHDANVISDAVNVSSRMEGLTKTFGASILISEETYRGIHDKAAFQFRYLGRVIVKGKQHVMGIYEVFNADESLLNEKKQRTLHIFNIGLDDYFSKRFAEAAVSMKKVLIENPEDKTAKRYLQNAAKFLVEGVEDNWTGVEYMNEK